MMKYFFTIVCALIICSTALFAQTPRIAFLPYKNMDGKMELNKWCYSLQDSLQKRFGELDPNSEKIVIVPYDTIEVVLADLNLDPTNPQFDSDMWKVVDLLKVDYVVSGNFVFQANRFLINTYIYDAQMRLPVTTHQARDIFVPIDDVLIAIRPISKKLQGYFLK